MKCIKLIIILVFLCAFLQGCESDKANVLPQQNESLTESLKQLEKNSSDIIIKTIPVKSLNIENVIKQMDKPGVYEIVYKKTIAVVAIGNKSLDTINAKRKDNAIEINYTKHKSSNDSNSLLDDAIYIENCDSIEYIRLYVNQKEKYFKGVYLSDTKLVI